MQINKDDLIEALGILNLVPARPGIPSSEFIRIEQKKNQLLLALSSDIYGEMAVTVEGTLPVPSPFLLDRRLFVPFVMTKMKQNTPFVFENGSDATATQLVLKHGRRKAVFTRVPDITGYGKITVDKNAAKIVFTPEQKDLLLAASMCATPDTAVPHLNAVVMNKNVIMSSNGTSILIANSKTPNEKVALPLFIISLLSNDSLKGIRLGKASILLEFNKGALLQALPEKALNDFPIESLKKIQNKTKSYETMLSINANKLTGPMERFKTYMTGWSRQDKSIVVQGAKGQSTLAIRAGLKHLSISENITLENPLKTDISIDLALEDILPVFQYVERHKSVFEISYNDVDRSPYVFKTPDLTLFLARKAESK